MEIIVFQKALCRANTAAVHWKKKSDLSDGKNLDQLNYSLPSGNNMNVQHETGKSKRIITKYPNFSSWILKEKNKNKNGGTELNLLDRKPTTSDRLHSSSQQTSSILYQIYL